MAIHSIQSEANSRGARMLRSALGAAIAGYLEDVAIVEVTLNPDGRLWIDRLSSGLVDTGETLSAADPFKSLIALNLIHRTPMPIRVETQRRNTVGIIG